MRTISLLVLLSSLLVTGACVDRPDPIDPIDPAEQTGERRPPSALHDEPLTDRVSQEIGPVAIDLAALGRDCADAPCPDGTTCAMYYGVAGASGPVFESCEVSCRHGKGCPAGSECILVADGPGEVCRPKR